MEKEIRFYRNSEINYKRWDLCVEKAVNPYFYAYSWYLDLVAEDWTALIYGDYLAVFPLPQRKKGGVEYLYQPKFTQQLGIFSREKLSSKLIQDFINAIPRQYRLVEINLNKYLSISDKIGQVRYNTNVELDLIPEYETLKKAYSSNLKRNLKKALANNLQLDINIKPEDLVELFKQNRGAQLKVYSDLDYRRLSRLIYTMIYKGMARVWGCYSEGNDLLAACVFVHAFGRTVFLFSGLSEEGKARNAMPFLLDSFIQRYAGAKMVLDFEGSNDPGLKRFYMSFGGSEHKYISLKINRLPFWLRPLFYLKNRFSV